MISLQKTFEYSACPHGILRTVKVFQKSTAVEYFQSIDPAITPEQVIRMEGVKSASNFTIEELSQALPTTTNL
jgi:hypothetical protein